MTGVVRCVATARGPVECADRGDGPVVVALHGAMGGWDQSALLAEAIGTPGSRTVAVSRPGYLGTPPLPDARPEAEADQLAALLDALGVRRAAVMAVSGGGPTALHFALRHPGRCWALVLVSTTGGRVTGRLPLRLHLLRWLRHSPRLLAWMERRAAARDPEVAARRAIPDAGLRRRTLADPVAGPLLRRLLAGSAARLRDRLPGTLRDVAITRARGCAYALEAVGVPTLVVHGGSDRVVPFREHGGVLASRIPGARLVTAPDGDHVFVFTHRALVCAEVGRFLRAHAPVDDAGAPNRPAEELPGGEIQPSLTAAGSAAPAGRAARPATPGSAAPSGHVPGTPPHPRRRLPHRLRHHMSAATEQRGARLRTRASSPDILRSFALLTLLASALPATPLAAQVVEDPDWLAHLVLPKQPLNHARACTGPSWGCAEDWQRHETARAERHLEGNLAFAQASSSYGKSRVAAFSGPSPFFARAYASALDVNQIGLLNTGASAAVQTVDFYAHAKVTGTVECPYDGQGDFRWGISIYQNIGGHWYSFAGHTKTARWNPPGCDPSHPSAEVKDRMSFDIHVPPASQVGGAVSYAIVTQLEAWSYGDFQVDARSTGSVYMPATPGVQIGTRNGFLRGQSIPDWAAPQQVVPEPSTVALTLGGIVALGIVTRRRAVRHPRPREEARRGPGGGSCGLRVTAGAP